MHLVIILPNTMQRLRPARKSVGTLILLAPTAIIRPTKRSLLAMTRFLIKPKLRPVRKKGWNAYDTCSRCDYTSYKEIAALGHDFTSNTWQSDAHRHWKKCSRCKAAGKRLNIPVARQPVRTEPFVLPVLRPMVHWMPNIM